MTLALFDLAPPGEEEAAMLTMCENFSSSDFPAKPLGFRLTVNANEASLAQLQELLQPPYALRRKRPTLDSIALLVAMLAELGLHNTRNHLINTYEPNRLQLAIACWRQDIDLGVACGLSGLFRTADWISVLPEKLPQTAFQMNAVQGAEGPPESMLEMQFLNAAIAADELPGAVLAVLYAANDESFDCVLEQYPRLHQDCMITHVPLLLAAECVTPAIVRACIAAQDQVSAGLNDGTEAGGRANLDAHRLRTGLALPRPAPIKITVGGEEQIAQFGPAAHDAWNAAPKRLQNAALIALLEVRWEDIPTSALGALIWNEDSTAAIKSYAFAACQLRMNDARVERLDFEAALQYLQLASALKSRTHIDRFFERCVLLRGFPGSFATVLNMPEHAALEVALKMAAEQDACDLTLGLLDLWLRHKGAPFPPVLAAEFAARGPDVTAAELQSILDHEPSEPECLEYFLPGWAAWCGAMTHRGTVDAVVAPALTEVQAPLLAATADRNCFTVDASLLTDRGPTQLHFPQRPGIGAPGIETLPTGWIVDAPGATLAVLEFSDGSRHFSTPVQNGSLYVAWSRPDSWRDPDERRVTPTPVCLRVGSGDRYWDWVGPPQSAPDHGNKRRATMRHPAAGRPASR